MNSYKVCKQFNKNPNVLPKEFDYFSIKKADIEVFKILEEDKKEDKKEDITNLLIENKI